MPKLIDRYKELDALRGIAALFVVSFHCTIVLFNVPTGFKLGVTGVDLFFIISGFVIFMSVNKVSSAKEFMINRVSRLYPTYWACVTFTYVLQLCTKHYQLHPKNISILDYLCNMTMFQYYFKVEDIDGPYWTMIVEMVFYISITLLLVTNKLKYIVPVGMALLGIILLDHFWIQSSYPAIYSSVNFIYPLLMHWPLFFAGILFYKVLKDSGGSKLFYYMGIVACFIMRLVLYNVAGRSHLFITITEYSCVLFVYFLFFTLFVNQRLGFIVNPVTLFLGKISFALYLIHQYTIVNVMLPALNKHLHINFWVSVIVAVAAAVSIAAFITYYIEVPFGKRLKSFLRSRISNFH